MQSKLSKSSMNKTRASQNMQSSTQMVRKTKYKFRHIYTPLPLVGLEMEVIAQRQWFLHAWHLLQLIVYLKNGQT